ncbi:MAG: MBOAT family O-acyltransferase [Planctomycetota bacterium]|jgi:alginate O-acetyltransferase complex protein AlgI
MVFISHIFIFYFLPIVLLVYYLLPSRRNLFLLCASYAFYAWLNPWFLILCLLVTVVNYVCGLFMGMSWITRRSRFLLLVASVAVSLGTLAFFKYFMFFQNNLNLFLGSFGTDTFDVLYVVLPVGISFYIFKSLSYSIDVYRGQSPPTRSFIDFACFVSFFPQLMAGPIQRYNTIDTRSEHISTFAEQLVRRRHSLGKFSSGAALFILGFAMKVLLADQIGRAADAVFGATAPGTADIWFGAIAYAFQIYIDFSAYSNMAIGLGQMFGFECPRNFNAPYLADSFTDFWHRWHISLSSWFRDYLYIPLGGNRRAVGRIYFNLIVVFLLCGLWHGANWTFVLWGAYHGAILVFERLMDKRTIYAELPRPVRVLFTFVLLQFSWVLFRSDSISGAWQYLGIMFGAAGAGGGSILLAAEIYTQGHLITMAICALLIFQPLQAFDWVKKITWSKVIILIILFCLSLMAMFAQAFKPFLYFQF